MVREKGKKQTLRGGRLWRFRKGKQVPGEERVVEGNPSTVEHPREERNQPEIYARETPGSRKAEKKLPGRTIARAQDDEEGASTSGLNPDR